MDIKDLGTNQKKMIIGVISAVVIIILVWIIIGRGPTEDECRTDLQNYNEEFRKAGIIFKDPEIVKQVKQLASKGRNQCSKYRSVRDGFDFLITKCNNEL